MGHKKEIRELLIACDNLIIAANNRDNGMGDPINLLICKSNLRDAAEKAREAYKKVKGHKNV